MPGSNHRSPIVLFLVCSAALAGPDPASLQDEPNAEKRSAMALVQVESEIDAARTAYTSGDAEPFQQHLKSAAELAGLSYKSLQDSGKSARRSPKWFKRAEQKLLKILRRVDSFVKDVSSEDRAAVEALRLRVSDIHDRILQDIMSKK